MTQKEALEILKTGRNVFLTGPAGSGKTYVLNQYIKYLKDIGASFGITASTGIAATHIGGITIHSWSGFGIKDDLKKEDILEIADKKHIKKNIKDSHVLIIDEVSMLHHFQLDFINEIIKEVKKSEEPFGGMQVVFCGDFFQLPPVGRNENKKTFFAFHSNIWKDLNLKICHLSEQHRQEDSDYIKILNEIRDNSVTKKTKELLYSRLGKSGEFEPTKLYTHNIDVDSENEKELRKLGGQIFEYKMKERGNKNLITLLKKSCLAPENLKLKIGAKVMFVKNNFEEGYVNGTLGIVEKCSYEDIRVRTINKKIIEVKRETWVIEEEGKIKAEINQYPLRLAWAITVHKSQGISLDHAEIDLSKSFEKGMGYVALSRVKKLDGLFLKGINEEALRIDECILEFDKKLKKMSDTNSFHIRTMGKEKIEKMQKEFENKIANKKEKKERKLSTLEETEILLDKGLGLKEISKKRNLKVDTILDHIEKIKAKKPQYNIYNLRNGISSRKFKEIYSAFKKIGMTEGKYHLSPVKNILGPKYSYNEIRLVRLFL